MDDARSIPPLRPVVPRPSDRQRDQRRGSRDPRSGTAEEVVDESAVAGDPPAAPPAAEVSLIAALDRLRTTESPRTADLALMRLWRGLRAYQAADDGSAPAVDGGLASG